MSCRGCWWSEGGRCYLEPVERMKDGSGRSVKNAVERCGSFESKRSRLETVIPGGMLVVLSEHRRP